MKVYVLYPDTFQEIVNVIFFVNNLPIEGYRKGWFIAVSQKTISVTFFNGATYENIVCSMMETRGGIPNGLMAVISVTRYFMA